MKKRNELVLLKELENEGELDDCVEDEEETELIEIANEKIVKNVRKILGMGAEELAREMGVTRRTLFNYEAKPGYKAVAMIDSLLKKRASQFEFEGVKFIVSNVRICIDDPEFYLATVTIDGDVFELTEKSEILEMSYERITEEYDSGECMVNESISENAPLELRLVKLFDNDEGIIKEVFTELLWYCEEVKKKNKSVSVEFPDNVKHIGAGNEDC